MQPITGSSFYIHYDRPESYFATHGKNYIYCEQKVVHGMDLIFHTHVFTLSGKTPK